MLKKVYDNQQAYYRNLSIKWSIAAANDKWFCEVDEFGGPNSQLQVDLPTT